MRCGHGSRNLRESVRVGVDDEPLKSWRHGSCQLRGQFIALRRVPNGSAEHNENGSLNAGFRDQRWRLRIFSQGAAGVGDDLKSDAYVWLAGIDSCFDVQSTSDEDARIHDSVAPMVLFLIS